MINVYVAAPLAEADRAKDVGGALRAAGAGVTSKWHDDVAMAKFYGQGVLPPEPEGQERANELQKNLGHLRDADVVLVLLDRGRGRCTLVEVGYALALGKRVVWLGERNIADAHPNVTYVSSEDEAIRACVTTGVKRDNEKPRYDLIPPFSEEEVAKVLAFGAKKYGDENWKNVDNARKRYLAAAMRHVAALRQGDYIDSESGFHHAAHAVCCLMFLMELDLEGCEL